MNPLTTFPVLLTFGLLAPLLLRLTVGIFISYLGWERYSKQYKWASVIYVVLSLLIILGFYTQIASILSIILISADYFLERGNQTFSKERKILYLVVKIILLSLLVTGPGFFAFDLPL